MTSLKKVLLSLAAAAALGSLALAVDSSTSAPAAADLGGAQPAEARNRIERLMKFAADKLDLTDPQITALKEVLRLHQPELQPLMERARVEREELRAIVAAEQLDDAALEAQASKIADTTKALTIASARLRADMRTILTPEQVDKLMQARQHMAQRRQHGREAFGTWLNEP